MSRPNILLLCPDEMKATALGCYGQPVRVSPVIDGWASSATRFEQCHVVHTKCVPSRASLLTGQYPHVGGHRTLHQPVRRGEVNMLDTLRAAGYRSVLVGKNDVVADDIFADTFDEHITTPHFRELEPPPAHWLPAGSYHVGRDPRPLDRYIDHAETTLAIEWLSRRRPEDPPFFLWLNWDCPHPPYGVPDPFYGRVDRSRVLLPPRVDPPRQPAFHDALTRAYGVGEMTGDQWREVVATYLEMTMLVDLQVERMLDALGGLGLRDDTIVVFWSDHGDFAGERQLPEKWDTAFYDCLTRVPLVIDAGGRLPAGVVPHLVESIDLMPTLLELAGVEVPAGAQGASLVATVEGRATGRPDVLCEGGQEPRLLARVVAEDARPRPCTAYRLKQRALHAAPAINARAKSIRDHRYRYVFRLGGQEELFDLTTDPMEVDNLAFDTAHRATLAAYRSRLLERLIEAETIAPDQDFLDA